MDKKYLHHIWTTRIKPIRPIYLIVAFLISATVCAFALRQNNLGMATYRDAVFAADVKGVDVEKALYNLRSYVYSHMNTRLATGENPVYPPIQLKETYQRLVQAEQQRINDASSKIYSDAQTECERMYPDSFSGGTRVPCIQKYVTDHGVKAQKIPDSMYKFDFASPTWSPDLAGWTLLSSIALGAAAILRILTGMVFKRFF